MIEDREALDLLDPREMRIDSVDGCLDLGADFARADRWLAEARQSGGSHLQGVARTIYQTLFIQTRGALKRELLLHLRRAGSVRRPQLAKGQHAGQGQIRDAVSIRERPPEAEDRAVPGHWEGDLLAGAAPRGPRGRGSSRNGAAGASCSCSWRRAGKSSVCTAGSRPFAAVNSLAVQVPVVGESRRR